MLGISFLLNLQQCVQGYISRFCRAKQIDSISSAEPFPSHMNPSSVCIKHEEKECNAKRCGHFQHLINTAFVFISVTYFFINATCDRNGLRDISINQYKAYQHTHSFPPFSSVYPKRLPGNKKLCVKEMSLSNMSTADIDL
jgi:hypothetical protein